jgi:hypothetical protein
MSLQRASIANLPVTRKTLELSDDERLLGPCSRFRFNIDFRALFRRARGAADNAGSWATMQQKAGA